MRWFVGRGSSVAHAHGDGHRGADGEDVLSLARAQRIAFQVDDPELVEGAPHHLAHPHESRPTQVGGGGDERDDARSLGAVEDLPERPAPEIDVVVVEILQVHARARLSGRIEKILQQRSLVFLHVGCTEAHPAALALRLGVGEVDFLPVVGRIAQADQHARVGLDSPGAFMLVNQGAQRERHQAGRRWMG